MKIFRAIDWDSIAASLAPLNPAGPVFGPDGAIYGIDGALLAPDRAEQRG